MNKAIQAVFGLLVLPACLLGLHRGDINYLSLLFTVAVAVVLLDAVVHKNES